MSIFENGILPPFLSLVSSAMIPRTLREVITASRKAIRDFKRDLEGLGEFLREGERVPVRLPVRGGNNGGRFPIPKRQIGQRQFSTSVQRPAQPSFQLRFLQSAYRGGNHPMTNTMRNAIFHVQPFRTGARVGMRGGVGRNMFSHLPHHNSRMFSTFGNASSAAQAAQNLSQGIRSLLLKGSELGINCFETKVHVGSLNTSEAVAETDMIMAGRVSGNEYVHEMGSFVEFDVNSTSFENLLPKAGIFDEELSADFGGRMEFILDYQRRVLADVVMFRDKIGSTSFKCINGKLRFYCPNCEASKMEKLLIENGIGTGIVCKMDSLKGFTADMEMSNSDSSSEMRSASMSSYGSVLSTRSSESSGSSGSSRANSVSLDSSFVGESVLSGSDNYFEQAIMATA